MNHTATEETTREMHGEPPAPGLLHGIFPVLLTLCLGAAAAAATFHLIRENDRQHGQLYFERDAKTFVHAFERTMDANLQELDALAAFLAAAPSCSPEAFAHFLQPFVNRKTGLECFFWAPVSDSSTAETSKSSSADCTVTLGAPLDRATPLLGWEPGQGKPVARLLELAAARGARYFLKDADAVRARLGRDATLAVVPVYGGTERTLRGFAGAMLDLGGVYNYAVADMRNIGIKAAETLDIDLYIYDVFGVPGERTLYFRNAPSRALDVPLVREEEITSLRTMHFLHNLDLGTSRWYLLFLPTPEYVASVMTWRPWAAAGAVLLFSLMLCAYFLSNLHRTRRIEALVRMRTAQLQRANTRLRYVNEQRRQFERERDQVLDLLEASNDSLASVNRLLQRSNEDLEDFAFVVSHDLKEPLRKIDVFARKLLDQQQVSAGNLEYLELIREAAARMGGLISHVLHLSRISRDAPPRHTVDLRELLESVESDFADTLQALDVELTAQDLPEVLGDPVQLAQLLQNLLANSLKFRRDGVAPRISLAAAAGAPAGFVALEWSDNGMGFSVEEAATLFKLFRRLPAGAAREGSGVGLSVCRKIVERHGGTIRAEGVPGQGANFHFTLPAGAYKSAALAGASQGTEEHGHV